ncbi:MAG: hypothetical protein KAG94_05215 [Clostridiales bacterium]|nr:hypothetical protein [Clostridiales bacterium]
MKLSSYFIRRALFFIPDKLYISLRYYLTYHKFPNIINGITFDEKIHKYILYYKNELMPNLVDKYKVREYMISKGYGHMLNELYGVYDNFDDIDFSLLPEQFVLKTNHGCGFNIIIKSKTNMDIKKTKKQINRWMHINFFYYAREWVYKKIDRKIICEKYLENINYNGLNDYKILCFHGTVKRINVMYNRNTKDGLKVSIYDREWNFLPVVTDSHIKYAGNLKIPKPSCLDEMIAMVEDISSAFPFLRVDVYIVNNQIILGELTFYPSGGLLMRGPSSKNVKFGSWLQLDEINKKNS